mmetsp:Transcript_116189/g.259871  ORF Transcript_116189/g.259871 Transcript_116189/m.259871 type:complete len:213 (-) Transcript_116189:271-909(-)
MVTTISLFRCGPSCFPCQKTFPTIEGRSRSGWLQSGARRGHLATSVFEAAAGTDGAFAQHQPIARATRIACERKMVVGRPLHASLTSRRFPPKATSGIAIAKRRRKGLPHGYGRIRIGGASNRRWHGCVCIDNNVRAVAAGAQSTQNLRMGSPIGRPSISGGHGSKDSGEHANQGQRHHGIAQEGATIPPQQLATGTTRSADVVRLVIILIP